MSERTALADAARRARAWLFDAALPYWADEGRDEAGRGFVEASSLDGTPLPGRDKRVRVQARQIYVMSHAALLGWRGPGLDAADAGFKFLTENAWHKDGGFVHILAPDGTVRDGRRDAYDHAFILLALAWYHRATESQDALDWVARIFDFIESNLWDARTDTILESVPPALPRRQNPHMHLLEAMLALDACTGDPRAERVAKRIVALFESTFFRQETGTLAEFFDDDWQPLPGIEGRRVEPGHHCEWVWLLSMFERRWTQDLAPYRRALHDFAHRCGRDRKSGLLLDEVRDDGSILKHTMRCWPQTEALKAALVRVEEGIAGAADEAVAAVNLLFKYYLDGVPLGLWQDQFDDRGRGLAKDVPASTLYHVYLAFAELMRVAGAAHAR